MAPTAVFGAFCRESSELFPCWAFCKLGLKLDWLQTLKQLFINVSYHILVASLTLMALF